MDLTSLLPSGPRRGPRAGRCCTIAAAMLIMACDGRPTEPPIEEPEPPLTTGGAARQGPAAMAWRGTVPALRGCHTQAESPDELMVRVREAIQLCLDVQGEDVEHLTFVGLQRITIAA
jgi:predicted RNase H-like HicB family nuclease